MEVAELPVSTFAVLLMFAVNLGTLALFYFKHGGSSTTVSSKRVPALVFTKESVMALLKEVAVFGLILFYVWVCENRPWFPHGGKEHVPDFFWFLCSVVILVSFGTLEHDPESNSLINRDQTEEWKGWMQTVFLLYHYFHAAEVYNAVRVMISCYVWMTGFGNLSFFYIKRDFGFVRFAQMMWRLNFSVVFLSLVMNNMYMLYYICPLHTFYFLVVFATMRVRSDLNHSKYGLKYKMGALAFLIFLVWEFETIFNAVFFFLPNEPHPGAAVGAYGIKYEWHFRSGLDHYATLFGMLFALNFPQATMWISKVEKLPLKQHVLVKSVVGVVLFLATAWWVNHILVLPKLEFNQVNPYTFFIPLLSYIYFRNCTRWLRQVHLGLLASIGKYTLETYLLQHHVWLTSNAKTILQFVPNYPKMNLILVTLVYVLVARRLYRATMVTRAMLIPDHPAMALIYLGHILAIVGAAGFVAWALQIMNMGWFFVVLTIIAASFGTFYALDRKIRAAGAATGSSSTPVSQKSGGIASTFVAGFVFCCFTVLVLPSFFPSTVIPVNSGPLRPGSGKNQKIQPGSPECIEGLTQGKWVFDKCEAKGLPCAYERWEWDLEKSCRFKRFHQTDGKKVLGPRTLLFLGDQTMYDLSGATKNLLDPSVGYSLANLQNNYVEESPQTQTKFVLASKTKDLLDKLKKQNSFSSDLVVLGSWIGDAMARVSSEKATGLWNDVADRILESTKCVVILPGTIFPFKLIKPHNKILTGELPELYKKAMLNSKIVERCAVVVDSGPLTEQRMEDSSNGIRFSQRTNKVLAQIILNGVEQQYPPPVASEAEGGSKTKAKGSGGGVAQNPIYGVIVLIIVTIILFTMDNYVGVAFATARFILPTSTAITISWEEATKRLHDSIGLDKQHEYAPVAQTNLAEQADSETKVKT